MTVLLLTGPAGSGKTTVATLLAERFGWTHISEDDIWPALFGRDRGEFGSDEHRRKRAAVHEVIFAQVLDATGGGRNVVIDATVHEAPPESFEEYQSFFDAHAIAWELRVLLPRLDVAIARDASRAGWHLGPARVAHLHAKFTQRVFGAAAFLDNSDETPEETAARLALAWSGPSR